MSISAGDDGAHILLFPFPTSGHIIPILDLAEALLTRGLTITILVTPSNLSLLEPLKSNHPATSFQSLVLSFPEPPSSTSPIGMAAKVYASAKLRDPILEWFQSHPSPPVAVVSDFFLGWTDSLAAQLGVPRIVFWPSGAVCSLIISHVWRNLPDIVDGTSESSLISFPNIPNSPVYPRWQVTQLSGHYKKRQPDWEFLRDCLLANTKSWGAIFNSFTKLEGVYIDQVKKEMGHDRVWDVGPLLPPVDDSVGSSVRGGSSVVPTHQVLKWLDQKQDDSVVYVCFGSRTVLSGQQIEALVTALELSRVHFVLCLRQEAGLEDRVGERGFLIKGWAPQVAILRHRAVGAFLTHCGWNSVLEGVASGVVMLTWPNNADQFINAKLLVDELGVALRACDGGAETVPESDKLADILAKSVSGDNEMKTRAAELSVAASGAVQNGGSSSKDLDAFVKQLSDIKRQLQINRASDILP